jgi:hypothetical protein
LQDNEKATAGITNRRTAGLLGKPAEIVLFSQEQVVVFHDKTAKQQENYTVDGKRKTTVSIGSSVLPFFHVACRYL